MTFYSLSNDCLVEFFPIGSISSATRPPLCEMILIRLRMLLIELLASEDSESSTLQDPDEGGPLTFDIRGIILPFYSTY